MEGDRTVGVRVLALNLGTRAEITLHVFLILSAAQTLGDTSVGVAWQVFRAEKVCVQIQSLTGVSGSKKGHLQSQNSGEGQEALPCRGLASH